MRSGSASVPSAEHRGAERLHQRVRGVERGAAVDARVQILVAGAKRDVEVRHAARREIEGGDIAPDHPAVEDDRRVRAALVRLEELDDRVAAGLLFAVAAEAHVDRQLAGLRELARGGEQHVQLALVVDGAAAVEVAVADLGLERRRVPQLERVGRLHVEVAVAEDGRRAVGVRRRADLADRERLPVPVDDLALAARGADEVAHPLARANDVGLVRGVGADRRDAEKLRQLVEPLHGASLAKPSSRGV